MLWIDSFVPVHYSFLLIFSHFSLHWFVNPFSVTVLMTNREQKNACFRACSTNLLLQTIIELGFGVCVYRVRPDSPHSRVLFILTPFRSGFSRMDNAEKNGKNIGGQNRISAFRAATSQGLCSHSLCLSIKSIFKQFCSIPHSQLAGSNCITHGSGTSKHSGHL